MIRNYKCISKRKMVKAYFTVEAACIYPFVIGTVLLVIYMWFFFYDRCLMEQDFAGVLVKGIAQQSLDSNSRSEYMENIVSDLYNSQYLCWNYGEIGTTINGFDVEVCAEGYLEFPFSGLNFWSDDDCWNAERSYKGKTFDRVFIIRTFRKITGVL